jgi:hypothetical protein
MNKNLAAEELPEQKSQIQKNPRLLVTTQSLDKAAVSSTMILKIEKDSSLCSE